jgi:hypothetical protein
VQRDGRWVSPADEARLEQERVEREATIARREAEEAELQAKRAQLSAQQAAVEAEANRLYDPYPSIYSPYYYGVYGGYYSNRFARPGGCVGGFCGPGTFHSGRAFPPVRQPPNILERSFRNDTSMSVVKVPYRRH